MSPENDLLVSILYKATAGQELTEVEKYQLQRWLSQSEHNQRLYDDLKNPDNLTKEIKEVLEISNRENKAFNLLRHKFAGLSDTLPLFFDSEEFSAQEMVQIISLLSDVYKDISGDPLIIRSVKTYSIISIEDPILV